MPSLVHALAPASADVLQAHCQQISAYSTTITTTSMQLHQFKLCSKLNRDSTSFYTCEYDIGEAQTYTNEYKSKLEPSIVVPTMRSPSDRPDLICELCIYER